MKSIALVRNFKHIFLALCMAALLPGCKKKEEATVAPVTPVEAAPAAVAATAPAASAAPAGFDAAKYLADNDAAIKAKEYDTAVQNLFILQKQRLNEQQAAAARNQMIQIQNNLATAVGSGDPRAKAAAEMIRQSSMH